MVQIVSDTEMAAILADMADSQVPALTPIKSPKRPCDYNSPVTEIPEPAPKRHKADEGSKSIRNRLTTLETRRAKCERSLQENTQRTRKELHVSSLRLAVQTKTTHQVRPRIPDRPEPDHSPSPYGAACPYDQTAGKELSYRQPGHQRPAAATTEPVPETAQFSSFQKPDCQQSQTKASAQNS